MEDVYITKLKAENNYLDYKIDKYSRLIATTNFNEQELSLVEKYMGKLIRTKIDNQKILRVMKAYD